MNADVPKFDLLKGYYYLAPLWLVLEYFLWPALRAELIVGNSGLGRVAFYGIEGLIGATFWFGWRWAGIAAFLENIIYLIAGFKYVLFGPLEIALSIETPKPLSPEHYVHSLPGVLLSLVLVVFQIHRQGFLWRGREP